MKKALYGPNGDRIDLSSFIDREGSINHKNWVVKPICPGCGKGVIPVNPKIAKGFSEARVELLSKFKKHGRTTQTPHFRHKEKNPSCPYDDEKDPFFDYFSERLFDYRDEKRVKETLFKAKGFNKKVIGNLFGHLTGAKTISDDEKKKLWLDAEKFMCRMSVLIHEPWIFPYAQALFTGPKQRTFPSGKTHTLVYKDMETQSINFKTPEQGRIIATIPKRIGLFYDNGPRSKKRYAPFNYKDQPHLIFSLSRSAAIQLTT